MPEYKASATVKAKPTEVKPSKNISRKVSYDKSVYKNVQSLQLLHSASESEAVVGRFSSKQVFLKMSQYSQENFCVGVSF